MVKSSKLAAAVLGVCCLGLFLEGAEVGVRVVRSEADLPERFCGLWQKGDFVFVDDLSLALIGGTARPLKTAMGYPAPNALGSILAFVPAGNGLESTMNVGAPQVRIKDKTEFVAYKTVGPDGKDPRDGSLSIVCAGSFEKAGWGKLEIKTVYKFFPLEGKILLTSAVKNSGSEVCRDLGYSVSFNANHSYSFSPFDSRAFPRLNFRVYPRKGHYLAWLNSNPTEPGKRLPGNLAPGETFEVRHSLLTSTQPAGLLSSLYRAAGAENSSLSLEFKNVEDGPIEVVVRELATSAVFFRTFLEEPAALEIPLPEGQYAVRANFFPAVGEKTVTVNLGKNNAGSIRNPDSGVIRVKIATGAGEYVPGKVSVIGLDPTRTPYFRPENPRETGRSHETFKNSVFPQAGGTDVLLPVGTYLLTASRGPEYTRAQRIVEVLKGDTRTVSLMIDRAFDTPNLVSVDPHLHTQNSDGRTLIPARLRSIVGEGVDVAMASDHNFVTDYAPVLEELGLGDDLAVIPGSEVTKPSVIHYNTYPMKILPGEEARGAIDIGPETPAGLFAASRAKNPGTVIQVNHPREGDLGYFNNLGLDKESASFAGPNFDTGFEVMEVMNGPDFFGSNRDALEDWFHLLARGYYFPMVGSSDSHGIDGAEPGFSRTYVFYAGKEGRALDVEAVIKSLRTGRLFVSNGPLVDFRVNGNSGPGDTLTATDGKVAVSLAVRSAPWVSVDEVRLIVNGERRFVFPVPAEGTSPDKFRLDLSFVLDKDAALLIEAVGRTTLYPVVRKETEDGLPGYAALPYAVTNPVFVDVDGNGRYDPVRPGKIGIKSGPSQM